MKKFIKEVVIESNQFVINHPVLSAGLISIATVGSSFAALVVPEFDTAPMESAAAKVFVVIALFAAVGLAFRMFKKA